LSLSAFDGEITGEKNLEGIEIIESRPGRLSLAIAKVKDNDPLAREVEYRFGAIRGIHQVEADAAQGRVSINYNRQELTSLFSLLKLKETFSALFPEISVTQLAVLVSRTL
jgi:hypothetical protein